MKKNGNVILIVIIIIAIIAVASVTVFIVYDKVIKNENNETKVDSEIDSSSNNESSNLNNTSNSTQIKDTENSFFMKVQDVFTITGRGTVATGYIERGNVKVGDEVEIINGDGNSRKAVVTGIEKFREEVETATLGENIGILFRGVSREEISSEYTICEPNSIGVYKK